MAAQRTEEALELLWNKFDRISMGSDDWELRVDIVEALGKMGLELAGERLCGVIDKKSLRQRSRWERLRVACVLALGELGGELAVNKLSELEAHANPDLRRAAEGALAARGGAGPSLVHGCSSRPDQSPRISSFFVAMFACSDSGYSWMILRNRIFAS